MRNMRTNKVVYEGTILNYEGWFSDFNPISSDEYVIEVKGHGKSVPFWIGDHLLEKASTRLGYELLSSLLQDIINREVSKEQQ